MKTVVIVGGGITGLAAAWYLTTADDAPAVTVLEAGDRFGGKIRTEPFAGVPVEAGPDTVLARVPWGLDLLHDLGLDADVVAPATGRAFVWAQGKLRPLPDGLVLGVPADIGPLAASGILSPMGLARAGLDLVLPRRDRGPDPTIADVIGGRFGKEALDRLVDPLLSGINAGRADHLSLAATAPDVAAVAATSRSLLLGLRARRGAHPPDPSQPVFASVRGGLGRLVERLTEALTERGVDLRTDAPVTDLDGLRRDVDAVVLTIPAHVAAPLVAPHSPAAGAELAAINHASVAVVTFAYPDGAVAHPLDGSGFLVPRSHGWLLTAGTFVSSKWPALKPEGQVLLRASAGRAGDDRVVRLSDDELAAALHHELAIALGIIGEPAGVRVDRWPRSFPQYDAGHQARVARIEAALADDLPGVLVAGAPYRGVGIASCIRQAREVATAVLGDQAVGSAAKHT